LIPATTCLGLGKFSADKEKACLSGAISLIKGMVGDLKSIVSKGIFIF